MANSKFMLHFTGCDTLKHSVWNHPDEEGLMGRFHKNGGTVFEFEDTVPPAPPGKYLKFFDLSKSDPEGKMQYVRTWDDGVLVGDSHRGLACVFTVEPGGAGGSFMLEDQRGNYVCVQCNRLMCNGDSSATWFTSGEVVDMGTAPGMDHVRIGAKYDGATETWTFTDDAGKAGHTFYRICDFSPGVRPLVTVALELTCDPQDEFYFSVNHRINVVEDSSGNMVPEKIRDGETRSAIVNIERIPNASRAQGTDSLADHFTVHVVPTQGNGPWGDPTLILKRKIT